MYKEYIYKQADIYQSMNYPGDVFPGGMLNKVVFRNNGISQKQVDRHILKVRPRDEYGQDIFDQVLNADMRRYDRF